MVPPSLAKAAHSTSGFPPSWRIIHSSRLSLEPSSAPGEVESNRWENLDHVREHDEVKFVIRDQADYDWAAAQVRERRIESRCTVLFSPVHDVLDAGQLSRWVLHDALPVRVQIQLHKVLWPGVLRGV